LAAQRSQMSLALAALEEFDGPVGEEILEEAVHLVELRFSDGFPLIPLLMYQEMKKNNGSCVPLFIIPIFLKSLGISPIKMM
jgi:hypothetical protein